MNNLFQTIQQQHATFVHNIQTLYPTHAIGWLQQLSAQIETLAAEWEFQFVGLAPTLSYNVVAFVTHQNMPAVLKLAPPTQSLQREITGLRCFSPVTPLIFAVNTTHSAVLMEQLLPGDTLKQLVVAGNDDTATRILCETIRRLRQQQQPVENAVALATFTADFTYLKNHVAPYLVEKAIGLFHSLTQSQTQSVVLHGDLHHDNVLSAGATWRVIDPHCYMGDTTAEVGALIRNPLDCFPRENPLLTVLQRRLAILQDELPDDPQRIAAWCYCISALSAAWTCEGFGQPTAQELVLLAALDKLTCAL